MIQQIFALKLMTQRVANLQQYISLNGKRQHPRDWDAASSAHFS